MKDLIVKISGSIEKSNFPLVKKDALKIIQAADKPLVEEEDFVEAIEIVKNCKAIEDAIAKAKIEAISEQVDITKLFSDMDEISASLKTTRLSLDKKVVAEKAKRREKLLDSYCEKIEQVIEVFDFKHAQVKVDRSIFEGCIKGKKKMETMVEKLDDTLAQESNRLHDLNVKASEGYALIEKAEETHPGLFDDKNLLVLEDRKFLDNLIEKRILKYEAGQKELKEKEERQKKATEQAQETPNAIPTIPAHTQAPKPQETHNTPINGEPGEDVFILSVMMTCTPEDARALAKKMDNFIGKEKAVDTIRLRRV